MKFLLIDDHPLFRLGFAALCEGLNPPAKLTFATTFQEAIEIKSEPCFDLVFIDLELPDGSGLDLLAEFRKKMPLAPCIIMSAHTESVVVQLALTKGAKGFISKSEESDVTIKAIELVLSGGMYIPKEIMSNVLGTNTNNASDLFTPKQVQILNHLARGESNKQISKAIFLSEGTVRNYVSTILNILKVKNRSEAVAVARSKGIISTWQ